jgi:hypothetical protein
MDNDGFLIPNLPLANESKEAPKTKSLFKSFLKFFLNQN